MGSCSARKNLDYGAFNGRSDHWGCSVWLHFRSVGASALDDHRVALRHRDNSFVGICPVVNTADRGGVPDSVHGTGRVGHHSRALI